MSALDQPLLIANVTVTTMQATGSPFTSPKNRAFSRKKGLLATSTSEPGSSRVHRKAKRSDWLSRSTAWISPQRWMRNRPSLKEVKAPMSTSSAALERVMQEMVKRARLEPATFRRLL